MDPQRKVILLDIVKNASFPFPNIITQNHNQGILLVEGSTAEIYANKIESNVKANIAFGGLNSGFTRIKWNNIQGSKSGEGIFVVEGEEKLLIAENTIVENALDGIVMCHSMGIIQDNEIRKNYRNGISASYETSTIVEENKITDNKVAGVQMRDPAMPYLLNNVFSGNGSQIKMTKHAKGQWP